MLSYSEFKKAVIGNYNEEQLKLLWEMMKRLASLEYELFKELKNKTNG